MKKIVLWRGYHSAEVAGLIKECWAENDLLILYPPGGSDTSFLSLLPKGELHWAGDWEGTPRAGMTVGGAAYPEEPVLGIFSTGTLGQKLVLYSKNNIESCLGAILNLFSASEMEAVFCYPQPFHTFGLVLGYVHCLLSGRALITVDGPYSSAFHEQWIKAPTTKLLTLGTPTHFKDLLEYVAEKGPTLKPTYASIVGAAKVSVGLWRDMRDELGIRAPSIGYGATEASPGVCHLPPGHEPTEEGEVGFPLPHLEVKLIAGEGLEFKGPGVCLAMIQDGKVSFPEKILIPDELAYREDGVLVYRGRSGLVLNRGGEKFSLEQIEEALKLRLAVDAICVGIPDPRLGEELGIIAETPAEPATVFKLLKQLFHRDFNSRNFTTVAKLPVNSSAKVDRKVGTDLLLRAIADA